MSQNRTRAFAASQNAPGSTGQPAGTAIATPRPKEPVAPTGWATVETSKAVVKMPTADTRKWMIEQLRAGPGQQNEKTVVEYFGKVGQIMPNEIAEELPLRFVPFSKQELEALVNCISNFEAGGDAVRAFEPHGEAEENPIEVPRDANIDYNSPDAPWRSFPMPWGKNAGVMLAELEKNYLFGLFKNYKVETEYNGKPKKPEAIAKDEEFRKALDCAGAHYRFEKKD